MSEPDPLDDTFALLMSEINQAPSNKAKQVQEDLGTSEQQVHRLTAKVFESAYEVLCLPPDASEKEIQKQYRKLSVLVHPDKCRLDNAPEAFQVLSKAFTDLKNPEYQDKYRDIFPKAKEKLAKKRTAENEARLLRGEEPLPMDGSEFMQAVMEECEASMKKQKEKAEYRASTLEANMERHRELREVARTMTNEYESSKRKWEKDREKRVAGWQSFQSRVLTKKQKVLAHKNIEIEREHRHDESSQKTTYTGNDDAYKRNWR